MKKLMLALLVALCSLSMAVAQNRLDEFMTNTTPEERAEMQTDYMEESLGLTEGQVPKIEEINLKYARLTQDVYNRGGRKYQRFKEIRAVSQDKDREMKSVLTKSQYETYQKNKEEMKEKIKAGIRENRESRQ